MQASQSGLWVHVEHDVTYGTDLRLHEAKAFAAELASAIGQVEGAHAAAHHPVGSDVAGAEVMPSTDDGVSADEALHVLTRKQLEKLAKDKDVDLTGAKTKGDVIEALESA